MKYFDWDASKNKRLREERKVGFEDVLIAVQDGRVLDVVIHKDQKRYPGQKILIVQIETYAYLVPFVEDDEKVFFKTIIPSRKATKIYLVKKKKL